MIKSPAVWAIIASNVTSDWGIYTMLTNIPTYMYEVLKFDMASVSAANSTALHFFVWFNITEIVLTVEVYNFYHPCR